MRVSIVTTIESQGRARGRSIAALLRSLELIDEAYLRAHPETPDIHRSGVRWRMEPVETREEFAAIPIVLSRGWGDCDDLAPWYASQLRVREGIDAHAVVKRLPGNLWHAVVMMPDGTIRDPSADLGME